MSRKKILGILSYILATAIVIGGTVLLVAYGNGYTYNFKTGKLVQRGLLLLSSAPDGASIKLGTKQLQEETPYRYSFEQGLYDFTLSHEGYRTWRKSIQVKPSLVSLHQYVILLRDRLKTESVATHGSISQMVASPNNRRIAFVVPSGDQAGLWVLNTQNLEQARILPLPTVADPLAPETFIVQSWSHDNSHLLVRHSKGAQNDLLLVANNAGEVPLSITTTFNINPENVSFNPTNWRQLYWVSEQGLHRLDVGNNTVSPVLAPRVAGYGFDGNRVLYVSHAGPSPSLWVLETNGQAKQLIETLPASKTYSLNYATYIRTPMLAVVAHDTRKTTLYRNLYHQPQAIELPATATQALFNSDGRFLLQFDEANATIYDLHENLSYSHPAAAGATGLTWFGNFHLLFNKGGDSMLSEYDGNYLHTLTKGVALPAFPSADTKEVVVAAPNAAGAIHVRALIIRE